MVCVAVRAVEDSLERAIEVSVVIEEIRVALYASFIGIIVIGIILTRSFASVDYDDNFLTRVFGNTNVCIYFDFPPSTYVLPALYNVCVFFSVLYGLASALRAWISSEEGKISRRALRLLVAAYMYFILSAMYFTTIFAVEPNPEVPHTMVIHSLPFVNLEVALGVLQTAITYFGTRVAWIDIGLPRRYGTLAWVHLGLQLIASVGKIVFQINALGDMDEGRGRGLWWSVADPTATSLAVVMDYSWLLLTLVVPLAQSIHLACKGMRTHAIHLTIHDNRAAVGHA